MTARSAELPFLETATLRLRLATAADVPAILRYLDANRVAHAATNPRRPAFCYEADYWQQRVREDEAAFAAS
jgi:ribosomal-protein-alanine N-acetyltransferase